MTSQVDEVQVEISIVLGRSIVPMQQLLRMGRGAVITLDAKAQDEVWILAQTTPSPAARSRSERTIAISVTRAADVYDFCRRLATRVGDGASAFQLQGTVGRGEFLLAMAALVRAGAGRLAASIPAIDLFKRHNLFWAGLAVVVAGAAVLIVALPGAGHARFRSGLDPWITVPAFWAPTWFSAGCCRRGWRGTCRSRGPDARAAGSASRPPPAIAPLGRTSRPPGGGGPSRRIRLRSA